LSAWIASGVSLAGTSTFRSALGSLDHVLAFVFCAERHDNVGTCGVLPILQEDAIPHATGDMALPTTLRLHALDARTVRGFAVTACLQRGIAFMSKVR